MKIPKNFTKFRARMRAMARSRSTPDEIIQVATCFLANEMLGMKDPTSELNKIDRAVRAAVWAAIESFINDATAEKKGAKKK